MFEGRKGEDFFWITPMLGPDNAGKVEEVGKELIEWRKQKPYPPLDGFAKIIGTFYFILFYFVVFIFFYSYSFFSVKAASSTKSPVGHAKSPLILSQRARVRPPPRK